MNAIRTAVSWAAAAVLLSGCASGVKLDGAAPVETRSPTSSSGASGAGAGAGAGAASGGVPQSQVGNVDLTQSGSAAMAGATRIIYFDFDSFVVKDDYRSVVESHAKMLSADKKKRVVVEGHTDERGGSEYNLALGQKRAEAVVRSLALLGAADAQLEAVSLGKERPAVQGSDETAWAKNRRAELNLR